MMKGGTIDGGPILQVEPIIIMWPRQRKAASGGIDDDTVVCGPSSIIFPFAAREWWLCPLFRLLPIKQHVLLYQWEKVRSLRRLWLRAVRDAAVSKTVLPSTLIGRHCKAFFAPPRQCDHPPADDPRPMLMATARVHSKNDWLIRSVAALLLFNP